MTHNSASYTALERHRHLCFGTLKPPSIGLNTWRMSWSWGARICKSLNSIYDLLNILKTNEWPESKKKRLSSIKVIRRIKNEPEVLLTIKRRKLERLEWFESRNVALITVMANKLRTTKNFINFWHLVDSANYSSSVTQLKWIY